MLSQCFEQFSMYLFCIMDIIHNYTSTEYRSLSNFIYNTRNQEQNECLKLPIPNFVPIVMILPLKIFKIWLFTKIFSGHIKWVLGHILRSILNTQNRLILINTQKEIKNKIHPIYISSQRN